MVICFNGIDGSGKSLQAGKLVTRLNEAGYPAVYVWNGRRAPLTRVITRLAKRLMRVPKVDSPVVASAATTRVQYHTYLADAQRILKRPAVQQLWLHKSLAEHSAEIWARVLPHLARGRIVVCDRYLYDTIISLSVLAGVEALGLPAFLRKANMYRVPQPQLWFFLDVPAEVGYSRKNDVPDILFLERRVPLYRAAAELLRMRQIDGTLPAEEISELVWQQVLPLLSSSSLRSSLGGTQT